MWPIRSRDQRLEDINGLLGFERMNVVLPRNRTSLEDVNAALAKWKLLSRRHINVKGLVNGLHKAGWSKLANDVTKRFIQEMPPKEATYSEINEQKKSEEVAEANETSNDLQDLKTPTNVEPSRELEKGTFSGSGEDVEESNDSVDNEASTSLEDTNSETECNVSEDESENDGETVNEIDLVESSKSTCRNHSETENPIKVIASLDKNTKEENQKVIQNMNREEATYESEGAADTASKVNNESDESSSDSPDNLSRKSSTNIKGSVNDPKGGEECNGLTDHKSARENQDEIELTRGSKSSSPRHEGKEKIDPKDGEVSSNNGESENARETDYSQTALEISETSSQTRMDDNNINRTEDQEAESHKETSEMKKCGTENEKESELKSISIIDSQELKNTESPIIPEAKERYETEEVNKSSGKVDALHKNNQKELNKNNKGSSNSKVNAIIAKPIAKSKTKSESTIGKNTKIGDKEAVHSDKKGNSNPESAIEMGVDHAGTDPGTEDEERDEKVAKVEPEDKPPEDISKSEEIASKESEKLKKDEGERTEDLDKKSMDQKNRSLNEEGEQSKKSDTAHEDPSPKPRGRKTEDHPPEAKSKGKAEIKKVNEKSAKTKKNEKSGKTKAKNKK